MYSVSFSNESAGDRASNLRTSCLRSSNRSFRKSFPSQVNKSNAKKHGGFPRRNIRFLKLRSATSIEGANFAINDRVRTDLTDARDAQFSGSAFSGRTQLTTTDPQTCC